MIVRHQHIVKRDLVEIVFTQLIDDRAHREAGCLHVYQQLRQAGVALLAAAAGTHQRNHVMGAMRTRSPHLAAIDDPARIRTHSAGAQRGQVRAGIGLAHADAKVDFTTRDARHDARCQHFGRQAHQQQRALALGDPVRGHRCAAGEQFFEHHIALQCRALLPAVVFGPGHAEPAACAERAAEGGVGTGPVAHAFRCRVVAQRGGEKGAHLGAQGFTLGRQGAGGDAQLLHGEIPCGNARETRF